MNRDKKIIESFLENTDIKINGKNSYDLQVHNEAVYSRILRQGSLGLGESYMDGWWDCENLDQFFHKILIANIENQLSSNWIMLGQLILYSVLNIGKKSKAFEVGIRHYDIGNDLYQAMLDRRLTYTCGYWKNAKNLDEAQEAKLDLVCQKIGLQPGQTLLDIGSGWGSLMGYAVEKYGVNAVGITVSKKQKALADQLYRDLPIETRLQDYRDVDGQFDRVVSLGMFEHVGYQRYRNFMEVAHRCLKPEGLFLLHTIGGNTSVKSADPWVSKYIFPNSMLPSISQISKAIEGLFVMEDWHNFGSDYDKTLLAWCANFEKNWATLKSNYNERFYRMWRYYLLMSAATFRSRRNQLWQIVLSKKGIKGGYQSLR